MRAVCSVCSVRSVCLVCTCPARAVFSVCVRCEVKCDGSGMFGVLDMRGVFGMFGAFGNHHTPSLSRKAAGSSPSYLKKQSAVGFREQGGVQ